MQENELMSSTDNTDKQELVKAISALLAEEPGQDAKQLGRKLGVHKSVLNPILYHEKSFTRSKDTRPRWYLSENADLIVEPEEQDDQVIVTSERVIRIDPDEVGENPYDEALIDPEVMKRFIKSEPIERLEYAAPSTDEGNPLGLYAWQQEALESWKIYRHSGIIDAVTGAGKTRLAIAALKEHLESGGKAVVLVPTIVLLHQWVEVVHSLLPDARIGLVGDGHDDNLDRHNVVIAVLASARTRAFILGGAEGLLIVDECHRSGSEKNQEALDDRFVKRLGLSATHERLDNAHETILLPYFKNIAYRLGYRRAIDDGVIANVRVAFVGVDFTEEEAAQYDIIVKELSKARKKLIRDCGVRQGPFSVFLDDVVRLTKQGKAREGMLANRWLTLWRKKKEMLAETPSKQEAISKLTGAIADADRTLLFTQSIKSANAIKENLYERGVFIGVHHSDIDSAERDQIMTDFEEGRLRALASVQTLEEGVDVPDADLAIIVASSKQRRQMIQRMGRVMRRKADGRDARFIILYVRKTDEDPRFGAHEIFVEELLDVARESSMFDLEENAAELREFLNPHRS